MLTTEPQRDRPEYGHTHIYFQQQSIKEGGRICHKLQNETNFRAREGHFTGVGMLFGRAMTLSAPPYFCDM